MNIEYITPPQWMEYNMMSDQETFVKQVVDNGEIMVKVSNHTKTRLSIFLYSKGLGLTANWKVDGFKTHEETTMNYFTHKNVTKNYFKVMKAQKLPELEKYISHIVNTIFGDVTIKIFNNSTIRSLV